MERSCPGVTGWALSREDARPNPRLRFRPVRVTIPGRSSIAAAGGRHFMIARDARVHPSLPAYTDVRDVPNSRSRLARSIRYAPGWPTALKRAVARFGFGIPAFRYEVHARLSAGLEDGRSALAKGACAAFQEGRASHVNQP